MDQVSQVCGDTVVFLAKSGHSWGSCGPENKTKNFDVPWSFILGTCCVEVWIWLRQYSSYHRVYKHYEASPFLFSPDSGRAVLFPHCLLLSLNATAVNQPPHLPPSYLRDSSNEVCVGIMAQKAACETVSYKGIHYPIHVCAKRKQRPVETLFKQFTSYKQCFSAAAAKQ